MLSLQLGFFLISILELGMTVKSGPNLILWSVALDVAHDHVLAPFII